MARFPRLRGAVPSGLDGWWAPALIVLIALAVRLPLALHAPPFVDQDTRQYLKPAFNLVAGREFALPLVRTPGYPLFLAAAIWLLGPDFQRVLLLQHLLGVAVALLATELGRLLYGRAVGLVAGLLAALSGPLLITEHALMTETLSSLLLLAGCLAVLRALRARREPWAPLFVGGLLLGSMALVRPIGQPLLALPALVCLLDGRGLRRALGVASLVGVGGALVIVPWMTYNLVQYGVFALTYRTGETLITHVALYARGRYRPVTAGDPAEDPLRTEARRIVNEDVNGSAARARSMGGPRIADDLKRKLGLSAVAADDLLRDLALERIRAQPLTYLSLLVENGQRVFFGQPVDLRYAWETPASEVWGPGLPSYPQPASAEQEAWFDTLRVLTGLYDPARLAPAIAFLFTLGTAEAILDRRARLALLPALAATGLILLAVGLVGVEYRYRYPVDPLITLVALGGLRWLVVHLIVLGRTVGRARPWQWAHRGAS